MASAKDKYVVAVHYHRDTESEKEELIKKFDKVVKGKKYQPLTAQEVFNAYFLLENSARYQHSQNEIAEYDLAEFTAVYEYNYIFKYYSRHLGLNKNQIGSLILTLMECELLEMGIKED